MKTTNENLEYYISLINSQGNIKIWLDMANGTNYIRTKKGNEAIFQGTKNACYNFLVGAQKLINPNFNEYTLNSNERVFQIIDSFSRNYFCNLAQISRVIDQNGLKHDYYSIYEFLNNKPKKCSKKHLNEMFAAHKIDFRL